MASSCESNEYTSVTGIWRCTENNPYSPTIRQYEVTISKSSSNLENELTIYNFHNLGDETETIIILNSDGSFELKNGPVYLSNAYVNSGSSNVNDTFTEIGLLYSIVVNGQEYQDVEALYIR